MSAKKQNSTVSAKSSRNSTSETESKRAEQALRAKHEPFQRTFNISPLSSVLTKLPERTIIEVNPAFEKLFGYARAEIIGKPVNELDLWADSSERQRVADVLLKDGKVKDHEFTFKTKSGKTGQGVFYSEMIEQLEEEYILTEVMDITERKQAEKQIVQMKRLYATLSQVNQTIVRVKDRDDLYQSICDVAVKSGEFSLAWVGLMDEALGEVKPVAANGLDVAHWPFKIVNIHKGASKSRLVATAIHTSKVVTSEDIAVDKRTRSMHEQFVKFGYHSSAAIPFRLKGRVIGVLSLNSSEEGFFNDEEEVRLLEEMGLDISFALDTLATEAERKQVETEMQAGNAKLDAALESMTDAVFISDIEGRFINFNEAFATFHKFRNKNECATTFDEYPEFLEVFMATGELAPLDQWAVPRALRGETGTNVEYSLRRKDTGETWVGSYSFAPIRDKDGAIVGSVVVGRDITEQKQVEEKIQRLNEELEERVIRRTAQLEAANKELEAFSYSVSHDLRAPLRAINGYTNILMEDYAGALDAEGQRVCNVIINESQRMGKLIDDLLSFSRLSRMEMHTSRIDMQVLVQTIFNELTTPEGRGRIDLHITNLLPAVGDVALLRQVWVNLISNALKFTSKKERSVIDVESTQNNNEIIYSVRDNGAGFDMQYADKLFGVFQRLHSNSEFEGTGVGLAIVHRVISRHGGRVWGEGKIDQGAVFYFTLPGVEAQNG